jgi:putative transposase
VFILKPSLLLKRNQAKCNLTIVESGIEAGIRSRIKKKFKATTNSRHNLPVAPNLLNQEFTVDAPDRTWVGDITYIHTQQGWLYLAVLLDLFNRKIVGWATSARLNRQLAIDALEMALDQRAPAPGLMHHSDQGSQYASGDYQKLLSKHGMTCSMSRKGNCYDNAVAESFFHLLKTEWVNHHRYPSRSEAVSSLGIVTRRFGWLILLQIHQPNLCFVEAIAVCVKNCITPTCCESVNKLKSVD